jgi:hypothetical protein
MTGPKDPYSVPPLPSAEVTSGRWYFGFHCRECRQRFAVFRSTGIDDPTTFRGIGSFQTFCRHCRTEQTHDTGDIVHFCQA